MNEREFGRLLAGHLNRGLTQIDRGTLTRLAQGRERALQAWREPARAAELSWAGIAGGSFRGRYGYLLPMLLLTAALAFSFYWQSLPQDNFIEEVSEVAGIDMGLLSADLPIQAYLDEDEDAWLDESSEG